MIRPRLFVFWAIAILFSACLCASAAENTNEKEKAKKEAEDAVEALEELTQKVSQNATKSLKQANSIQSRVQSHRASAQNAISQIKNVPNGNTKAEAIAKKVTTEAKKVISLKTATLKAADDAVNSMAGMVTKTKALVTDAGIETELDSEDSESSINYTEVNRKIAEVNDNVLKFQTEMQDKEKLLAAASALELEMSALVDKIKVQKYHFSVTLFVSQIDTVLMEAKVKIANTEKKRDEVNNTLKEMMESSQNAPKSLTNYVNKMIQDAEGALVTASKAVDDAKQVKEEMMQVKATADAALKKFNGEKKPKDVEEEVENTKRYAADVSKKAHHIAIALQSAELTATRAESRKKLFMRALSSCDTQPSNEDDKITNKPGESLRGGDKTLTYIENTPLSTTNKKSITQDIVQTISESNTESSGEEIKDSNQKLNGVTKASQNGSKVKFTTINSKNTVIESSENRVQKVSKKLTSDEREQQKVKNLNVLKNQLPKGTKNGTNNITVVGIPSALSVLCDGSLTVSAPLLGALIASAVLH